MFRSGPSRRAAPGQLRQRGTQRYGERCRERAPNTDEASAPGFAISRIVYVATPGLPRKEKTVTQASAAVMGPHRTGPK